MMGEIDEMICRAVAASKSPDEAAATIRQSLDRAGYVITKRPDLDQAPVGYLPVFRASEQ